jgi:hypothetical protein
MERWRVDCSIGVSFADVVRALPAEVGIGKLADTEVNQTWPFSSIIGLCMLAWLSQIFLAPVRRRRHGIVLRRQGLDRHRHFHRACGVGLGIGTGRIRTLLIEP